MNKKKEGAENGRHKERLRNMKRNEGVKNKKTAKISGRKKRGGDERKDGVVDKSNEEEIGRKEGWSKGKEGKRRKEGGSDRGGKK